MAQLDTYYRPEWTCGRYNSKKKAAIMYNLITGMAHLFEEESAMVIGAILSCGRNNPFDIIQLSNITNINNESLIDFLDQLIGLGLITRSIYSKDEIDKYREKVRCAKRDNQSNTTQTTIETEYSLVGVEEEYANIVGGWSNVIFEITYQCNARCIHCYNVGSTHMPNDVDRRADRHELSLTEYKNVIDQFISQGMFKACLTGGDPFSSPIIWDILQYLYDKEIAVEIYTNGISIVGNTSKLISLYPRIVGISIYSAVPEVHDSITRIQGSLKKSLDVMNQLYQAAIPLQLKCCVFKNNIETYTSVYELADRFCAAPQIEINIRNTIDGNKFASQNLRLKDDEYEILFNDPHISPTINTTTLDRIIPRDYSKHVCKAGITSCTVTPEGNIIPCPTFHLVLGNIRDSSLQEIKGGKVYETLRRTILKDYKECGRHDYCDFCGICPGENHSETGSPLLASDNKCFMARKRLKYARKIYQG